ncbi:MAG: type II toxin-antitoxin system Phd/YefM family antitoxin [Spirochaetia bacterium]
MEILNYTEFRNHSKRYFDAVEEGESFIVVRKGKAVARISPYQGSAEGWKRKVRRVSLKSSEKSALDYLVDERREE